MPRRLTGQPGCVRARSHPRREGATISVHRPFPDYLADIEPDTLLEQHARAVEVVRCDLRRRLRAVERIRERCPVCAHDLPRTAFARDASRPNGLQWDCRDCALRRRRRQRAARNAIDEVTP